MPKISVIVPVYNTEQYLPRCIDSILAQTFTDFELLLIDDGSKDNSGKICDEYAAKDSRIRVFHKENGGVSSARNLGLDNAQGDWIAFCDSDDYTKEYWLQIFIENSICSDIVCQGIELDYTLMQEDDAHTTKKGFDYEGSIVDGLNLLHENGLTGSMCLKFFQNNIIQKHNLRLDERFNYMEDEEFVIRYMKLCKKMKSIRAAGYYYYYLGHQQLGKYSIKDQFGLYQSLFNNAYSITKTPSSPITSFYLEQYTSHLIEEFKHKIALSKMYSYKKDVGKRVLLTNMFWLTKWCILLDPTLLLSSFTLYIHNKFKPRIS